MQQLHEPYELTGEQRRFYAQNHYLKLPQVFDAPTLQHISDVVCAATAKVAPNQLTPQDVPLTERDTYGQAFIQKMNLWRHDAAAKEVSFSRRLARIACELLGVTGVRMYHDQALFKEPGTPPHATSPFSRAPVHSAASALSLERACSRLV
eukprot:scaffold447_cov384-Prasinococcus_capsulatus_cf.AAC.10